MTLTNPINPGTMIPNSQEILIAKRWSDPLLPVGFYKDPDIAAAGETSEDVYANGTLSKTKDGNKLTVTFSLHEMTNEKVEILQHGLISLKPGTVVDEEEIYKPGSYSFEDDILLKYSNQDGTAVSITSVKALVGGSYVDLTENTDYSVVVTTLGATAIKLIQGSKLAEDAPQVSTIKVVYSATADDIKVQDHHANAIGKAFVMVLVQEYEYDGKKKYIKTYLGNCTAKKATRKPIADADNTTVGMPLEITGTIVKEDKLGFSAAA